MPNYETIGTHPIYFNEVYYLAYVGGYRELSSKDQKEWQKTLSLPEELKRKEQNKLGYEKNPNVVPVKGIDLLSYVKELRFVPLFDKFFEHTHLIKLTDLMVYESIKAKNYDMMLRGI